MQADDSPRKVNFGRDIRPILSDKCFFCHGPDENTREAELRLDTKEAAHTVLTPGDGAASELVRRITSADPDELMPPPGSNRTLPPEQIALLKRWIDEGAPWGEHWSFSKPTKPTVPDVAAALNSAIRNPIDSFVQLRLAEHGLRPSPEASKEQLLRRVTLDLTGLPPTPEELAHFLQDEDPNSYERVVDRLLQSAAFGERMAWDWLDAARYADSNGYQGDADRTMWPWRDWVVDAFNRNLPYDQFTVFQLAGDLLPDASFEQTLATGFNRNHMINGEGGRIPEENRAEYVMDMAETVGTVWLGLTLNCCRCHDHKYDQLTQRDYYSFFAFFNQTPVDGSGGNPQTPPVLAVPGASQKQRTGELEQQIASLEERRHERAAELAGGQAAWEARQLAQVGADDWQVVRPSSAKAEHQELQILDDGSVVAKGSNPANDAYTITATSSLDRITGLRLEALRHESLTENSLSRADSGNFVLTNVELLVHRADRSEPEPIKIGSAEATFEQGDHKITAAFDENPKSGWAVWEGHIVDREHAAVFRLAEPIATDPQTTFTIVLRHDSTHANHNLGRFRLSVHSAPEPKLDRDRHALLTALRTPGDKRTKEQTERIAAAYQNSDETLRTLDAELNPLKKELEAVRKATPKVMVMEDLAQPRKTFLLERGQYNAPGAEITAAVPASLPALSGDLPANRLALARWIVSPENPLTARVTVNRFWQQLFGVGLVKTTEDFGVQGEVPLQMDLLDWLAADFRDSGWDVKALLRTIVTSHTYRQSSKITDRAAYEADPENRLLARGPRFRMPSWMLRDQALAASGLLVRTIGGAPVNGYQPAGVWEEATFGNRRYTQDHGEALYRRSIYTFWRRIIAPTMFFDNASRQTCTVKVVRTNTPLHSLLTLNDITFVEASRALAERALLGERQSDEQRLEFVFRRVLARAPSESEKSILLAGLSRSTTEFGADTEAAKKLLSVGESQRNERLDLVQHASWTALCLAALNLDETLTKE